MSLYGLLTARTLMSAYRKLLKTRIPELHNLFIVENLCPKFRAIFDAYSILKKEGKIKHVWSFNGIVHFRKTDNYEKAA